MRRRISIVMAVALLTGSACAAGDIDLDVVLDELGTTDMSESDDPGVQAAGETVVEILSVREAEENLARGVAERDLAAVEQASRLRPDDPKYPMYEAAILKASEFDADISQRNGAINRSMILLATQNPKMQLPELVRVGQELNLTALRDVLRSGRDFEGRDRLADAYCKGLTRAYPKNTEKFPQEVASYLLIEADYSLIPNCRTD